MKTIEQIARELGDDWDTTLPEDKVFIENVAKAYLSAWLEQQSQEPVAYMAPSGTCVTAEDVSYTPNWTDYYTIPLVRQADAAAVIAANDAEIERLTQSKAEWKKVADENLKGMSMCREQLAAVEKQRDELLALLLRAEDAIEALDGTSVENEKLVDDYRALIEKVKGAA